MKENFLATESKRIHKATRKRLRTCSLIFIILFTFLYICLKNELDSSNAKDKTIIIIGIGLVVIMVLADILGVLKTRKADSHGENLILPFSEASKQENVESINQDAANGILYQEYIYDFANRKQPYGEKIVLTASYLLICDTKITVIPRNKIYWICAQVGYKGGPYRVRLMIFTTKKLFEVIGVDIEHVKSIAEHLYAYIPNIFHEYNDFEFTYQLEELYTKDHYRFRQFYEETKKHYDACNDNTNQDTTKSDKTDV